MALVKIKAGDGIPQLEPWGKLADTGAEILDGSDIDIFGKQSLGDMQGPHGAAYFGTSKGKYRLVYYYTEQATIVEGQVRITDESTGEVNLYGVGDSWTAEKGSSTVWEVLTDRYVKHFFFVA